MQSYFNGCPNMKSYLEREEGEGTKDVFGF